MHPLMARLMANQNGPRRKPPRPPMFQGHPMHQAPPMPSHAPMHGGHPMHQSPPMPHHGGKPYGGMQPHGGGPAVGLQHLLGMGGGDPKNRTPDFGWAGLDDVFQKLQGGPFSNEQFQNMAEGHTPGGMGGRFLGLSPQALKFISSLMVKNQPQLMATEGLQGDDLFKAELQNRVTGMQPGSYGLHGGLDQGFFEGLIGGMPGWQNQDTPDPIAHLKPRKRRRRGISY